MFRRLVEVMGMPELAAGPPLRRPPRAAESTWPRSTSSSRAGPSGSPRPTCSPGCTRRGCPRGWSTSRGTCSTTRSSPPGAPSRPCRLAARRAVDAGRRPSKLSDTPGEHSLGGSGARCRHRRRAHRAAPASCRAGRGAAQPRRDRPGRRTAGRADGRNGGRPDELRQRHPRRDDPRRPAGLPRRHRTVRQRGHSDHHDGRTGAVRHDRQRRQLPVDGTADGPDLPEQEQRDPGAVLKAGPSA